MPIARHALTRPPLTAADLEPWASCPSAIAGDAMNRARCVAAAIKPLWPGARLLGPARTVQVPAGDNAAIHIAVALARAGDILVIDAGGHEETGVWGDILTTAAIRAGIAGIVLDGASRDAAEIVARKFPVFCRAVSPRGGQKGPFGSVDGCIAVGGVSVESGDLVIGDDDGVALVPYAEIGATLSKVKAALARESEIMAGIAEGRTTADLLGIPIPEINA